MTPVTAASSITPQNAVFIVINLETLGNHRKVDGDVRKEFSKKQGAEENMVNITKRLIDSPEFKKIGQLDGDIRRFTYRYALQSPLKAGIYMLSTGVIEDVVNGLEKFRVERQQLVDALCSPSVYTRIKRESKERLGDLWTEIEFPTSDKIREAFKIEWQFLEVGTPKVLNTIKSGLFEKERRKAEAKWAQTEHEIKIALRVAMHEMIAHMADKLGDTADGKKKIFRDSSVTNVTEFLDMFKKRTIVDDPEMEKLVEKAKKVMKGIKGDDLRRDEDASATVRKTFTAIEKQLEKLIVEKPKRKITFAE
jgi:hypothetical protein